MKIIYFDVIEITNINLKMVNNCSMIHFMPHNISNLLNFLIMYQIRMKKTKNKGSEYLQLLNIKPRYNC